MADKAATRPLGAIPGQGAIGLHYGMNRDDVFILLWLVWSALVVAAFVSVVLN
jgi:hypothetical protein